MLERRIAAKSASSLFYEEYNDVDIYIEDTAVGYRKIFKELLNKALGSKFSIAQVFPIGTRNEVIAECEKNQEPADRKRVYIVDGDFYLLNGGDREDLKGLFVLPRYCIENYFFNEDAIAQTAYEEEAEMEIDDILRGIDFNHWLNENEKTLLELFIVYAICFKHIPSEQTISFKVTKLCSSNSGIVCPDKINLRITELRNKLIAFFGEERLELEIGIIKEKIKSKDKKLLRFVSGKDYLLPLMIARLQSFLKFSPNSTTLRIRLAIKSEVDELKEIENYIFE
jgi:hypothetical protein